MVFQPGEEGVMGSEQKVEKFLYNGNLPTMNEVDETHTEGHTRIPTETTIWKRWLRKSPHHVPPPTLNPEP